METRFVATHEVVDHTKNYGSNHVTLQGSGQDCANFSFKNGGRKNGFGVRPIKRN